MKDNNIVPQHSGDKRKKKKKDIATSVESPLPAFPDWKKTPTARVKSTRAHILLSPNTKPKKGVKGGGTLPSHYLAVSRHRQQNPSTLSFSPHTRPHNDLERDDRPRRRKPDLDDLPRRRAGLGWTEKNRVHLYAVHTGSSWLEAVKQEPPRRRWSDEATMAPVLPTTVVLKHVSNLPHWEGWGWRRKVDKSTPKRFKGLWG